jgi:hypothetical protein
MGNSGHFLRLVFPVGSVRRNRLQGAAFALVRSVAPALLLVVILTAAAQGQTHTWDSGVSGKWSESWHWTPNTVPDNPAHFASLTYGNPAPYTVTLDMNATLGNFTFAPDNGIFTAAGRTFTVNAASNLGPASGALVEWFSSTWAGAGLVTNSGLDFDVAGNSSIENFRNEGLLRITGNSLYGNAILNLQNPATSTDRIHLSAITSGYSSFLKMIGGGLLSNSGTVETRTGSGGIRYFDGALDNMGSGTFLVDGPTTFRTGPFSNGGTFTVTNGNQLSITSGLDFTQQTGSLNVNGTFLQPSGTFNFNGGNVTGSVSLANSTLNVGLGNIGSGAFTLMGLSNSLGGDVAAAQSLRIEGNPTYGHATITALGSFENSGAIRLDSIGSGYSETFTMAGSDVFTNAGSFELLAGAGGVRYFNGALDNQAGASLNVEQNATLSTGPISNSGSFTVASGKQLTFGSNLTFNQEAGTLAANGTFLLPGGTLNLNGGTITGVPSLASCAVNFGGSFTTPAELLVQGSGSTIAGNVNSAGQIVHVEGNSVYSHATLTAPASFVNGGTIRLESAVGGYSETFTMTGSEICFNTGTIEFLPGTGGNRYFYGALDNQTGGSVSVQHSTLFHTGPFSNSGSFTVAGGQTLTFGSGVTFNQEDGTLDAGGTFLMPSGTLNLNGGTITGVPSLASCAVNFGGSFTTPAELLVQGSGSTIAGNVNSAGQIVHVEGNSVYSHATLTAPASFVNGGTIRLESAVGGYSETFIVSGSEVCSNTGTIEFLSGTGGNRYFNGALDNQTGGSVSVQHDAVSFATGPITNSGSFSVAAGEKLTFESNMTFNQEDGTLDASGTFLFPSGTLNLNGGTITGVPSLASCAINLGGSFTTPMELLVEGSGSTITGDIKAGQTFRVQGNPSYSHATLTAAQGFENAGTVSLESASGGYSSTFIVQNGPFVNTGLLETIPGAGGSRTLSLELDNRGRAAFEIATNLGSGGYDHVNTGFFVLEANTPSVTLTGNSFTNAAGGKVSGTGTINATATGFVNDGFILPGKAGAAGRIDITGDVTMNGESALFAEIGGYTSGSEYDLLAVSGTANLGGRLIVRLFNGYTVVPGDQFTILTGGTVSGTFDTILLHGFPGDKGAIVEATPTAIVVRMVNGPVRPVSPPAIEPN